VLKEIAVDGLACRRIISVQEDEIPWSFTLGRGLARVGSEQRDPRVTAEGIEVCAR